MAKNLVTRVLRVATAILSGATEYSSSIAAKRSEGFNGIEVALTNGSDNVTITQQCSLDDSTWYNPVDSDGNAIGAVCAALTSSGYIQFSPVMAPYIRFKIVAGANSTVALKLVTLEETR